MLSYPQLKPLTRVLGYAILKIEERSEINKLPRVVKNKTNYKKGEIIRRVDYAGDGGNVIYKYRVLKNLVNGKIKAIGLDYISELKEKAILA